MDQSDDCVDPESNNYKHNCDGQGIENRSQIIAAGFYLKPKQQKAIDELWNWHEQSKNSNLIIGGPLTPERRALVDQVYKLNNE